MNAMKLCKSIYVCIIEEYFFLTDSRVSIYEAIG